MRTELVSMVAAFGIACGGYDGPGAETLVAPSAPASIQADCELTAHRCTQCHTLDRVLAARVSPAVGWQPYVRRMRLMPGAGIPSGEEPLIVRCLDYRLGVR